jgi:uncharacterized membrane protein YjjP (DUF1212 family)
VSVKYQDLEKSFMLISEIAVLLMQSGANTKRVIDVMNRFAKSLDLKFYALISHKSMIITLKTLDKPEQSYTNVRQIPSHAINFYILSEISHLSWTVLEEDWSFDQIRARINDIKSHSTYPYILIAFAVSLAGAGFAKLFGGDYYSMLISFLATFTGMFVAKLSQTYQLNPYLKTYLAAFSASLVASCAVLMNFGTTPHIALATSVLFLVPGVALINYFNDLYNNHILNGSVRLISGFTTVLFIGLSMLTAMFLCRINF